MKKIIHASGKRKSAVARATVKSGNGMVRVNGKLLDVYEPMYAREKINESIILAGDISKFDINVQINGGGVSSQADAARLAIARALVETQPKLKTTYLDYDRTLLVADVRRKEVAKPNSHGQARAKRQKSYR